MGTTSSLGSINAGSFGGGNKPMVFYLFTTTHKLGDTRCTEWSRDDSISLLTEEGVYIFTCDALFFDSWTSLYPNKYFIPNPKEPLVLSVHSSVREHIDNHNDLTLFFNNLNFNEGYNRLHLKYQLACWSPRTNQCGCILALLTYDHRLTLYSLKSNEWHQLSDISILLDRNLSKSRRKKTPDAECFEKLDSITIESMTWSELFEEEGKENCLLVCATRSGHCHFFRLTFLGENVEINLVSSWLSGLGTLTYLTWFKDYLVLCSKNGQVIVLKLPMAAIDQSWDDFVMVPKAYPWKEADGLPVQHIFIQDNGSGSFSVVFAKSCYIIISNLQEATIARKHIITSRNTVVQESKIRTTCTGLCMLPDSKLLAASPDQLLSQITFNSGGIIQEEIHPVNNDEVVKNLTPYGLASSPNQFLTCLSQTMTKLHDHLLLKEPTRIIVFPNLKFEVVISKIESLCSDPGIDHNGNSPKNNLMEYIDLFHALRGYYLNGYQWIPSQLQSLLADKASWPPQPYSIFVLKVLRFVALSIIYCSGTKSLDGQNAIFEEAIQILEDSILHLHIDKTFDQVFHQDSRDLTRNQLLSIRNMSTWVKRRFHIGGMNSMDLVEKCPICEETIPMVARKEGSCPNNHRFGRCTNSLLLCDSVTVKYERCKPCGRHLFAVPCVWKNYWKCLFCS